MVTTLSLIVFIAQLLCCIFVRNKVLKYLPSLLTAAAITLTVVGGTTGDVKAVDVINAVALVEETKVMVMCGLAVGIYQLALWIRNRKKNLHKI